MPGLSSPGRNSQTMTVAPCSMDFAMNECPSTTAPFMAINRQSFFTFLESICTSAIDTSLLPLTAVICTLYNMSVSFFTNGAVFLFFDFFQPGYLQVYFVL